MRNFVKLVIDANPIISALLGGTALKAILSPKIKELAVTEKIMGEIRKYIPFIAEKVKKPAYWIDLHLSLLPLTIYPQKFYVERIEEAKLLIGKRDPKDIDILALGLKLGYPIWTNDKDFEEIDVKIYATARLLKVLEII